MYIIYIDNTVWMQCCCFTSNVTWALQVFCGLFNISHMLLLQTIPSGCIKLQLVPVPQGSGVWSTFIVLPSAWPLTSFFWLLYCAASHWQPAERSACKASMSNFYKVTTISLISCLQISLQLLVFDGIYNVFSSNCPEGHYLHYGHKHSYFHYKKHTWAERILSDNSWKIELSPKIWSINRD